MASQGVNVLRYSALVAGLVYGVYHQSSLNSVTKRAEIEHEYARKERLIEQAKAEYKKKTQPQQETKTQTSGRTFDPPDDTTQQMQRYPEPPHLPNNPSADQNSIVITNFEDPKFDLEAFLKAKAE
ncbi:hypothetical protein PCG10_002848 [Penicillium crustosum]|uniref:ATP synthase F(0) complex subunit e, mitochondrial n=1 Tax=Penicillium crustosum TaxID=36656 RepID=A0A9P5L266_PENCR|nr:hypothetical protein PCG10_002848 [Penicillium crustosum]